MKRTFLFLLSIWIFNMSLIAQIDGGTLETTNGQVELMICAGDGSSDAFSVNLNGNQGTNSAWVITDANGNILGLPPGPPFDLEGAGTGICLVWHLSHEDDLEGAEVGQNANDLTGTFDLSNPITVTRNGVNGGELMTEGEMTEITICAGNGESDAFDVLLNGIEGSNSAWVITDSDGNILGLPSGPPFDLEGAGAGTCLIWHLSFEDGLEGAEVGLNANDLEGCFDLSNPIIVTRNQPDGGTLEGGHYEFCVGDGIEDNVSGITITGNSGSNAQWIVTDEAGTILGLPPMPGAVNFDGAGAGVCLIWHLSYEDGLEGLEAGLNANDLFGCFDLSNPISVYRFEEPDCNNLCISNGGFLEGGPFEFCVGDGIEDNVSDISLTGNSGTNSQWVITDDQGTILGLPPIPGVVNFDGAGAGVCLIWHLSYEDGLEGLEAGLNANDLQGCYDLSNPIEVVRLTGNDCTGPEGVDLELSIEVDDTTYEQYENVTYTIIATNNGSVDATNIIIEAGLPNGMVYTDDNSSAGDYSLFFEEWQIDELEAGESATLELVLFTLVENVDINNFVQVLAQEEADTDSTPGNGNGSSPQEDDEAAIIISPENPDPTGGTDADLELSIEVSSDTYDQYENVTYTISLTNQGPDNATGIDVSAGLPDGMVYTDHSATEGDYNLFFEEWNIDFLASGETAVLELVLFTLIEDADINNFVEVIASDQNDADSTPDNGNGTTPQEDDEAAIIITFEESFAGNNQAFSTTSSQISQDQVRLYPVPTNDQLTLEFVYPQEETVDLRIFNLTGKVVHYEQYEIIKGLNKIELNTEQFVDGIYFINIQNNNSDIINERFQKLRR